MGQSDEVPQGSNGLLSVTITFPYSKKSHQNYSKWPFLKVTPVDNPSLKADFPLPAERLSATRTQSSDTSETPRRDAAPDRKIWVYRAIDSRMDLWGVYWS